VSYLNMCQQFAQTNANKANVERYCMSPIEWATYEDALIALLEASIGKVGAWIEI